MNDLPPNAPGSDDDLLRVARKRVGLKMGFYTHLLIYVLVNAALLLLNRLYGGGIHWHMFPLMGWGLGLLIHGIVTLISLQGMGWRERMLAREVEALRRRQP